MTDKQELSGYVGENTDRELWREDHPEGEAYGYYAPSIHVTKMGGIGINVNGTIIVKSLREWHALAGRTPDPELAKVTAERDEALEMIGRCILKLPSGQRGGEDGGLSLPEGIARLRARVEAAEALLASRTLAIEAAIEAMEPFRRVERAIPPERPDDDIVAIEMYHTLSEEAVAQIGASSRNARLVLSLDGTNAGHFRKLMSVLAQLRSLIAGKETDVG